MLRILTSFWNPFATRNDLDLDLEKDIECSAEHEAIVESVYDTVFQEEHVRPLDEEQAVSPLDEEPFVLSVRTPFVKPRYYTFETQTPIETLNHLKDLGFNLEERIQNYPGKIRFGRLAVPMDPIFYHTLIGANGYFLQRTCETWGLIAILPIENELFFWGTRSKVIKAMNVLRHRIQVCGSRLQVDVSAF